MGQEKKQTKPNCYDCKFRREVAGSAHSSCAHPVVGADCSDPFANMMATLASVGRVNPVISQKAEKLNVRGNATGIRRGWFNWPWDFDPVWLEHCDGFEQKPATITGDNK